MKGDGKIESEGREMTRKEIIQGHEGTTERSGGRGIRVRMVMVG